MADNTKASTEQLLETRVAVSSVGDAELSPGVWYDDFKAVKAAAEKTGKPLVAMWINPPCGFCKRFCTAALHPLFNEAIRTVGAYLWLGSRTDKDGGTSGYQFCFQQSESPEIQPQQRGFFPGLAVWQCEAGRPDKVLHDFRASGRVFEQEKSGEEGVRNVIRRLSNALTEPPHKAYVRPAGAAKPQAQGGCPGGHPHLKALQQINDILKPFFPAAQAQALPLVGFNGATDAVTRLRVVQAIADNGGHCPCKKEKTPDTVCLCREFRETGRCACGLFARRTA